MPADMLSTVLLFALMGGALYFLMIRPQQKRQKEQQAAMSALEPGSRVMLISGILATVKYLGDKQAVVEVSPGVEMTVDKRAISSQPVEDEFEYADDAGTGAEAVVPAAAATTLLADDLTARDDLAAADDTVVAEAGVDEAQDAPVDEPTAWDQPGTEKN